MFELNWKSKREWRWLRVIWMVLWVVLTIFLTWRIKCLVLTCHHLILLYGDDGFRDKALTHVLFLLSEKSL
ncbi:unnamed protein product [Brassica oleracea]